MRERVRTSLQKQANDFDCELFRLLDTATEIARGNGGIRTNQRERDDWKEVAHALRNARPYVRKMMHREDQSET